MARIISALALLVAVAAAAKELPRIKNKDGNLVLSVGDEGKVGYVHGGKEHFLNPNELPDGVAYMQMGFEKGMDIGAGDKDLNAKLDTLSGEEKKIMDQIVEAQKKVEELQKDFDAKYTKLEERKAEQKPNKAATVTGASKDCIKGWCRTEGGGHVTVTVQGEVYSNAPGVFECMFTYKNKQDTTKKTSGTGVIASASGQLSAVLCDTPSYDTTFLKAVGKFDNGYFAAAVTVAQLGEELKKSGSGSNAVHFYGSEPELSMKAESVTISSTSFKTQKFAVTVSDTDTPTGHKVTVTVPKNEFLDSVKVSGSGPEYMLSFVPKSNLAQKFMDTTVTITAEDVNGMKASKALKVTYVFFPLSCAQYKKAGIITKEGVYDKKIVSKGGKIIDVFCVIEGKNAHTMFSCTGLGDSCRSFRYITDANSCRSFENNQNKYTVSPFRSRKHFELVYRSKGQSFINRWTGVPAVHKPRGGGRYTNCNMRHSAYGGGSCGQWKAPDGKLWWLRDSTYGEPNGDYGANCNMGGGSCNLNSGFNFNDYNCRFTTSRYFCGTSDYDQ